MPDSVHIPLRVLHPEDPTVKTNFDVIFFHGLQIFGGKDAWRTTWMGGENGNEVCWPAEWLPQDLKNVRVLSFSYDSDATKAFGRGNNEDVTDIGENLTHTLTSQNVGSREFVLVGHSFGGLVIKSLLTEMDRRSHIPTSNPMDEATVSGAKAFLRNLKGIVFYATPHSGSDTASWFKYLKTVGLTAGIMQNLKPFQRKMQKLSTTTFNSFGGRGIVVYAFCEGRRTAGQDVVPVASAMQLAGEQYLVLEDCNHMRVCKPLRRDHLSYVKLVEVLRICGAGRDSGMSRERMAVVHESRGSTSSVPQRH